MSGSRTATPTNANADPNSHRLGTGQELVYCHRCQNEWYRNEHGLTCPNCESDFTEIVSERAGLVYGSLGPSFPRCVAFYACSWADIFPQIQIGDEGS